MKKGWFREVRRLARVTQLGTGFGSLRVTPEHSFRPWSAPPHSQPSGHRQKEGGAVVTLPLAVLGASTVSRLGLQSASQPRLSYAEMAEDYPRYPDIHDLDLTLLNPRMIVVRGAVPLGRGHGKSLPLLCLRLLLLRAKPAPGNLCCLSSAGRHPVHEPFSLHCVT